MELVGNAWQVGLMGVVCRKIVPTPIIDPVWARPYGAGEVPVIHSRRDPAERTRRRWSAILRQRRGNWGQAALRARSRASSVG